MANLTNAKIANTFKDLLQVNAATSNSGIDDTVRQVQDGGGTAGPFGLSNTRLDVTGQFALNGTVLTATASQLNDLVLGSGITALTTEDDTILITRGGVSVSTATASATVKVNPELDITRVIAGTGNFTTKVCAAAALFTGQVSGTGATFSSNVTATAYFGDGSNLTNIVTDTSVVAFTINRLTVVSHAVITSATFTNAIIADDGVKVDNITIDGTEIDLSSGSLTLDVAADIVLDAAGEEVIFKDGATNIGHISMASDNLTIKSLVGDKDVVIQGVDDSSNITALTLDMSDAGTADFNHDVKLKSDSAELTFGADSEIKFIHVADSGLNFKHADTGDDKFPTMVFQTGDTDIAAADKLGVINFQAPDEAAGTDAILVAAGIEAVSEGDFAADNNATKLSFKTGASEAATEKVAISSDGNLNIPNDSGKIQLGASADLQIFHDGANSQIVDNGTGNLKLQGSQVDIVGSGETMATFVDDGAATLFHDNSSKLATTATGIAVTGVVTATDVFVSAVAVGVDNLLGKNLHIEKSAVADIQALTDGTNIAVDFNAGQNFTVTLGGNRTLDDPTNCVAGQVGSIFIVQDGTGSRTLAYGGNWDFTAGTAPTLSTDANAIDRLDYIVHTSTDVQAVLTKAYS
tara:strand:+ start:786 stop:2696 length:1911 start_codon:yes stop_codon:yes gene_type:complete